MSDDLPVNCLNCNEAVAWRRNGQRARFCVACGQETNVQPPTLMQFAQQFGGAYLSTEGALWRTLKLLLTRPGELTRHYLEGRRKHYVLPLRLYLTISVLALLVVRLLGSGDVDVRADAARIAAENRNFSMSVLGGQLGLKDGVYFCERLPQWLCARAQRHMDVDAQALPAQLTQMKDRFIGNLGAAMFLLVPSFAAGLKLVYRNRGLRYTEHLVFALHTHAFWFIALALVVVLPFEAAGALGIWALPIYGLLAMRRVYGGTWVPRLLRALLVSVLYSFVLSLAIMALGLWTLLS